jgi:ribosomal protein L10
MNCVKQIQELRKLVSAKFSKVKVIKAGMALRKFKVIEDRSFREDI